MTKILANNGFKKVGLFLLAFAIIITMIISGGTAKAYAEEEKDIDIGNSDNWDWYKYANATNNNSVVKRATPRLPQETQTKWAAKFGTGWAAAPTPPLIDKDGFAYIAVGSRIVQLYKETGKETESSKEEREPFFQGRNVGFAMNPMLYAEGKFFVQIANGALQCVDAESLKPLWVAKADNIKGQTVSNLSYKKIDGVGYVYLGTWNGENRDGQFFAVKIDNEGITEETAKVTMVNSGSTEKQKVTYKVKKPAWTFTPSKDDKTNTGDSNRPRGFYWSGAYVTDKYLAIGTDDGTSEGQYKEGSTLYTLNPKTGKVIDSVPNIKGDIRTSVSYDDGYLYYSTKGGHVHKTQVTEDGKLSNDSYVYVGGMTTATPVVYKDRIYIGVSGKSQFDPNSDHKFVVIDNSQPKLSETSIAYKQDIPGYPQATPLLTTEYMKEDFDKATPGADGRIYVYFTYNAQPGGIYAFYDVQGAKEPIIKDRTQLAVYTPDSDKQQFCISPIVADQQGTLYYKNDSCHLFAVKKVGSVLESLDVTNEKGESYQTDDGKAFKDAYNFKNREYSITVDEKTTKVNIKAIAGIGDTLTINDKPAVSGKPFELALDKSGKTIVNVKTVKSGSEKVYKITIVAASDNANAHNISVTNEKDTAPWAGNTPLELTPNFAVDETKEMISKPSDEVRAKAGNNIWVTPENDKAVVKVEALDNVNGEITKFDVQQANDGHKAYRFRVNAKELNKDVKLKVTITSESGKKTKTYLLTVGRQYRVEEVQLNKTSLTLDKGAEETLTYTIKPTNADIKDVEWTSSNPNVAKVDENGKVTAVSRGDAEIKATTKDGKKEAICKVTVNAPMQKPIQVQVIISNKTALKNLVNEYGSNINIPDSAKGEILNKTITLNDGDNLLNAVKKELDTAKIAYKANKEGTNFSEIAGLKEKINIISIFEKDGKKEEADKSGWTYLLNGEKTNAALTQMKYGAGKGANDIELTNGDAIQINYTVDGVTVDKEYKQSFAIDKSEKNIDLTVGETHYMPFDKLKVEPDSWAAGKKFNLWLCYVGDEKIATMEYDKKGFKITAKSAGKTTIKVTMPNEISDEVTVNVKPKTVEKPEPRILIDGTAWDMNKTFETTNSGPHSLKVQIKKNGQYVDVDTKKIKWEITNGATSRVNGQAFWISVDHEATFKATLEEYPNENVFFKAKLKAVPMTDFKVQLPTTYRISAWNNLEGNWSSKSGGSYFVGIIEGEGSDNYKIIPTPANATNTEVTWEALTPEIATYMEYFKNGIVPTKAGKAKFKVTSKANPQLSKIVEVDLQYKIPMTSAEFTNKEIVLKPGETTTDLGLKLTPEVPSEQRFNWTFDKEGIVENEEVVESTGKTGDLPKFIHKITAKKPGTVTATATPWDMTGGAKPITVKIHVIGDLDITADQIHNEGNNVTIDNGKLVYTKGTSLGATWYIKNGVLSRLEKVKVDDTEINANQYEAKEGSIILTLKKDYLDNLSVGTHKLTVQTKDGNVESQFEVKDAPVPPKYNATYEFKSMTVGMDLPEGIAKGLLPASIDGLADKTKVTPTEPKETTVEVEGGKWIFKGYDPKEATIDGADIKFVGSWAFEKAAPTQKEADKYNPTSEPITVDFGKAVTKELIKKAIKGIPDDAMIDLDEASLPDGKTAGAFEVNVTVMYKDQSQDKLVVKGVVKEENAKPDPQKPDPQKPGQKDDGSKGGKTTVEKDTVKAKDAAKTGDTANALGYAGIAIAALGAGYVIIRRKRNS